MSKKHPVIAVTGSSGAGTTTVKVAFEHIFRREGVNPLVIEGDSYHGYDRNEMKAAIDKAAKQGKTLSHFGPDANLFGKIEETFKDIRQDRRLQTPLLPAQRRRGRALRAEPGRIHALGKHSERHRSAVL